MFYHHFPSARHNFGQPYAARPGMACRWSSHFWPWTAAGTTARKCGDGLALRLRYPIKHHGDIPIDHSCQINIPWYPHDTPTFSCKDEIITWYNLFITCPCFLSAWQRCGGFSEASSLKKTQRCQRNSQSDTRNAKRPKSWQRCKQGLRIWTNSGCDSVFLLEHCH